MKTKKKEIGVLVSVRLPPDVREMVKKWQKERNCTFTYAVSELLRAGVATWQDYYNVIKSLDLSAILPKSQFYQFTGRGTPAKQQQTEEKFPIPIDWEEFKED